MDGTLKPEEIFCLSLFLLRAMNMEKKYLKIITVSVLIDARLSTILFSGVILWMTAFISTPASVAAACCASGASTITTYAGIASAGYTGDGGPATSASLSEAEACIMDAAGNLYFCDSQNHVVRKVSAGGTISTFAGNGTVGNTGDGGPAASAQMSLPWGLAMDAAGNLYISDNVYCVIRKVTPGGIISTFAGTTCGYSGDGGPATSAKLFDPYGIAFDASGDLFIADGGNHVIREVSPGGIITTVAGNGTVGFSGDGGPALSAQLNTPDALAIDPSSGDVYFDDNVNYRIRKFTPGGTITTIAGNGSSAFGGDGGPATLAGVYDAQGLAFCGGSLYLSDTYDNRIRAVDPTGVITTLAGNGLSPDSGNGGPATLSLTFLPAGLYFNAAGDLFASGVMQVRKISSNCLPTPTPTNTPSLTPTWTLTPTLTLTPTQTPTSSFTTTPTNSPTPMAAAVTDYGCFAQSGDGGDAIISDINGYASPPPPIAVVVTPVSSPGASWPSFCGSGSPISDNKFAWTTATLPTTMVFQRSFTITPALISGGSFGITFGADDEAAFVLTNSLYPAGVTLASCFSGGGVCLACHSQTFLGSLLAGSGVNTLTMTVINTGNIALGPYLGFAWFHYSICVWSGTPTPTPTNSLTPTSTNTPTKSPTQTPTSTFSNTATPSPTNSPTKSPTVTPTSSPTLTATQTPTLTITNTTTITSTPTNSPTITPTLTFTPVPIDIFYVDKNLFSPSTDKAVSILVSYNQYPGEYNLRVYNTAGEHIKNLDSQYLKSPVNKFYTWDGTNKNGDACASGVYIFYLIEPYSRKVKRVLLVR